MRSRPEWIGKNDDHWPPPSWVYRRKFEQAGEACEGPCHRKLTARDQWDLDHKVRLRDGGENREGNLQVLCKWCHGMKTSLENAAAAHANRWHAMHHGYARRSQRMRDGNYKYDWKRRCYVKILSDPTETESEED